MTRIHTYRELTPSRPYYALYSTLDGRTEAYYRTVEDYRRYVARYGGHFPTCRWSYELPEGAEVIWGPPTETTLFASR